MHPKVMGSSGTARAIEYSLRRWKAPTSYLDDGRYPIDNNPVENAIRQIALGRKNLCWSGCRQRRTAISAVCCRIAGLVAIAELRRSVKVWPPDA